MSAAAAPAPFATAAGLCCCSRRTTAATPLFLSSTARQRCGLRLRSTSLCFSGRFSSWSGLNRLGVCSRRNYTLKDKKEKRRGKVVYASLFGVGAPEALVIGVVALLVFGPKGLAEVARTLGKTLRAFQPTIRELQEVSREFKTTLEREIGLEEVSSSTNYINKSALYSDENRQTAVDPNGTPSSGPYNSEELLKVTKDQLAASAARSQDEGPTTEEQPQAASTPEVQALTSPKETDSNAQVDAEVPSSSKAENQR